MPSSQGICVCAETDKKEIKEREDEGVRDKCGSVERVTQESIPQHRGHDSRMGHGSFLIAIIE